MMHEDSRQIPAGKDRPTDRAVLLAIRRILADPSLSDSDCIEQICRIYETLPDMPQADRRTRR